MQPGLAPAPGPVAATDPSGAPAPAASNASEQNGASNAPLSPSSPSNTGNAGTPNPPPSANPPSDGAAGASMVPPFDPGNQGAGGAGMGPSDGSDDPGTPPGEPPPVEPEPPVQPPPVQPPPVTVAEPVIDTDCPNGAFFCSGFEQAAFPVNTVNIMGGTPIADAFQLDTSQANSGQQSLFIPLTNQAFSYRVTAIDVPVQAFWARVFLRSDTLIGDNGHDALFAISSGDNTVDNNNETRVEFSEQEGTIVLNRSTDQITFPLARPTTLAANTWHCVETRFDGDAGDIEVFANGEAIIRSLGNAQFRFQVRTFRIGILQFHDPRNAWFDDVVLSTERVGCN